jgi:nucleotide-binding universal stress UspA family protein
MFTRILVPIDFSASSGGALEYARKLAARFGASLHLLHVLENDFLRPTVADPQAVEAGALRQLRELLTAEDHQRGAVPVVLRSDAVAEEIVSYARSNGVDLIVMGTHGRNGIAHLLQGSVAERVVRTAPCMVLTGRDANDQGSLTVTPWRNPQCTNRTTTG